MLLEEIIAQFQSVAEGIVQHLGLAVLEPGLGHIL